MHAAHCKYLLKIKNIPMITYFSFRYCILSKLKLSLLNRLVKTVIKVNKAEKTVELALQVFLGVYSYKILKISCLVSCSRLI